MMASKLKNDVCDKYKKSKTKFSLPISALLSYLCIATLILSGISLAKFTTASSDSVSARAASFSVSAEMKNAQDNKITLLNSGECQFDVINDSEVSVIYKVIIKGLPAGVAVTLTAQEESVQMISDTENAGELVFAGKLLESSETDVCTLLFTAYEEMTGIHNVSVQVQFEQTD